ncbi:MAG: hypothetical protein RMM53_04340 [Bacteroidia bacterium]|nr:hypothetical protein [Bacteroidia bacterium]MDW8333427.1 hypothetical protein [Bacteroidia bacterium]
MPAVVTFFDVFVFLAATLAAIALVLLLWGRRIALWLLKRIHRQIQRDFVKTQNYYQDTHKHTVRKIQLSPTVLLTVPVENEIRHPPDDPQSYAERATEAEYEEI